MLCSNEFLGPNGFLSIYFFLLIISFLEYLDWQEENMRIIQSQFYTFAKRYHSASIELDPDTGVDLSNTQNDKNNSAILIILIAGLFWSFGPLVVRYIDNAHLIPWQYLF